jgi:hypothetical protein
MWLRRIDGTDDVEFIQRICRRAAEIIEQQARDIERLKGVARRRPSPSSPCSIAKVKAKPADHLVE